MATFDAIVGHLEESATETAQHRHRDQRPQVAMQRPQRGGRQPN